MVCKCCGPNTSKVLSTASNRCFKELSTWAGCPVQFHKKLNYKLVENVASKIHWWKTYRGRGGCPAITANNDQKVFANSNARNAAPVRIINDLTETCQTRSLRSPWVRPAKSFEEFLISCSIRN